MAILLSPEEIYKQSTSVFGQFGESKWIPFAKENVKLEHRPTEELRNIGIGRHMLLAAQGASLEEKADIIKKYRDRVVITTNDKCFGPLLEHGVKADFVMLCDCNILFKHIEPYIEDTKNVALLSTPYANPEWTRAWKGPRYFYVNKDAIQSEQIFIKIFGKDMRIVPAGSNVSNAMLIFWTGSDERQNINWGGFEKYILVGYDYSWRRKQDGGNYYAWNDPEPKRYYMQHRTAIDPYNNVVFSSENLIFSAKWMESYITSYGLPVVNASGRGLLGFNRADLEDVLRGIRGEDYTRRCKNNFEVAKAARAAYDAATANFDKAREELICRV